MRAEIRGDVAQGYLMNLGREKELLLLLSQNQQTSLMKNLIEYIDLRREKIRDNLEKADPIDIARWQGAAIELAENHQISIQKEAVKLGQDAINQEHSRMMNQEKHAREMENKTKQAEHAMKMKEKAYSVQKKAAKPNKNKK